MEVQSTMKPSMDMEKAKQLIREVFGLNPTSCKEFNSYDDRNYYLTVSGESLNKNITDIWPHGYILKVTNGIDSSDTEFTDAQNMLILHLAKSGLPVPQPVKNVNGEMRSVENIGSTRNIVRLLKFLPGKILFDIPDWTTKHFYQCGQFVSRMDSILADFQHPAYIGSGPRNSIWFLSAVPQVAQYLSAVQDEARRELAADIIKQFTNVVKPLESTLESGIIHGDFNEQNIIMKEVEGGEHEVYGVLDFGDSHYNPLIYELAITIMYMMTQCRCISAYKAGGHVVAGYIKNRKLCEVERKILKLCVAARYAQSLVMGAFSYQQQPWNEYLLITSKTGWTILQEFWNIPEEQLYREWDAILSSYNPSQSSYFTPSTSQ